MKKIFTLALGVIMSTMMFAADHRPTVTLNNKGNYKIVIDGRSYFASNSNINLSNMQGGRHTIKVYELRKGFFARSERLVDAATFDLRRNDVVINIQRDGDIVIRDQKSFDRFDRGRGNDGRDDRDHRF